MQQKLIKVIAVLLTTTILYANSATVLSYATDNFLTEKALDYKEELDKIIDEWQEFLNDCIPRDEYNKIATALEDITIKVLTKLGKK